MLESMEFVSHGPGDTQEIAAKIARGVMEKLPGSGAQVIALEGELGAGKTTFVQGFLKSLGVEERVKSPTFLLMKQYVVGNHQIYHLDCYRLASSQDLIPLEFGTILQDPQNIVLVEWPERIADILPEKRMTIHIDHVSETERKVTISP